MRYVGDAHVNGSSGLGEVIRDVFDLGVTCNRVPRHSIHQGLVDSGVKSKSYTDTCQRCPKASDVVGHGAACQCLVGTLSLDYLKTRHLYSDEARLGASRGRKHKAQARGIVEMRPVCKPDIARL
jgi:hypothetical protein